MHWVVYLLYRVVVTLIWGYKWVELQVFLLLTPFLKVEAKKIMVCLGVVLQCEGEKGEVKENGSGRVAQVLARRKRKYGRILKMKVKDDRVFARIATWGTLGFGEAVMDKSLDFGDNWEDLTEVAVRYLRKNLLNLYYHPWNRWLEWAELNAFNLQTRKRAFQVGERHYDLGNDLYELMLDPWMQYTCAYYKGVDNLNDAQVAKMKLIAEKLDLKPGMRVLDIGCGWGTLCKYLAQNYQVECVGVTVSQEGVLYGNRVCAGLPVDIRLQDYRDVHEKFDRVVSIGCLEHVGHWNYREFFEVARRCLADDDGLFLVHSIAINHYNYPIRSDRWSSKYIFPNGECPRPADIVEATKNLWVIEDWHNIGPDYAETLLAWRENFVRGWPLIREKYGGEPFFRLWMCYLSLARALFKARRLQLWQIVLSKDGLKREYRAAR